MKYSVEKHIVRVIGHIWMPNAMASMEYTLTDRDLEQYGISKTKPTRAQVQKWVNTNTGDFQSIEDFSADIGANKEIPWAKGEESEFAYIDTIAEVEA